MESDQLSDDLVSLRDLARRVCEQSEQPSPREIEDLQQTYALIGSLLERARLASSEPGRQPLPTDDGIHEELLELNRKSRRQEALLEAIFDTDPGCLAVLVGPDLVFAFANPAYRFICPRMDASLLGQKYTDVWASDRAAAYTDQIRQVLATGRPFQKMGVRWPITRGAERTFTLQARRIDWEDHQAALLILWDTTNVDRATHALRESQARLVGFLESTHDSFFALDRDWRFVYANQHFAGTVGKKAADLIGKNFWESLPEVVNSELEKHYRKAMEEKVTVQFESGGVYTPGWYDISIYPTQDGISVFATDRTEEKNALEGLRRSEALYRAIGESIDYGIWVCDPAGRNIYASDSYLKLVGMTQEQCSAFGWGNSLHPDDAERTLAAWQVCVRTGDNWDIVHRFRGVDGQWHPILARGVPVKNEQGEVIFWAGINLDIGEQIRTQEALKESESKFGAMFQNAPMAIALSSLPDGKLIDVNRAFENTFEYTREEVLGRTTLELGIVPDAKLRERIINEYREKGRAHHLEISCCTKSGRPIIISGNIDRITVGEKDFILNTFENITERKQAESDLQESEARYRDLFEGITEGFALHEIICDENGKPVDYRFLKINPAFERITGLKAERVVGRTVREALPGIEDTWIQNYGEVALTGKSTHFTDYSQSLGKHFEVVAFSPRPMQFAVLFFDITNRLEAEAETRRLGAEVEINQRLAEQRERERLEIARDLHDGPLQELTGAAFLLQGLIQEHEELGQTEEYKSLQAAIYATMASLRSFAQELRPPTLSRFGLEVALRSHLQTLREKHPGIEFNFDAYQEGPLTSEKVRVALFRIYQEALNNIFKHAQATRVDIRFRNIQKLATLEIRDNGIGFERVSDWVDLAREGHLGLVGIRERAESVGGKAEISSVPGQGTEIRLTIPY